MNEGSTSVESQRAALEQEIKAVFPVLPLPEPDAITYQPPGNYIELQRIKAFLTGKWWIGVTLDKIVKGYKGDSGSILVFLSLEAFRYYYPAFLTITLKHHGSAENCIASSYY